MPGEFTSRFDKEILKSTLAEQNQKALAKAKEQAEQDRIEQDLQEIGKLLERRSGWFKERFANARPEKVEGLGFQFKLAEEGDKKAGTFSLRTRLTEERLAIRVESFYEIPSRSVKENDYIALPTNKKVDLERARRFIESKLFDFAKVYVG